MGKVKLIGFLEEAGGWTGVVGDTGTGDARGGETDVTRVEVVACSHGSAKKTSILIKKKKEKKKKEKRSKY